MMSSRNVHYQRESPMRIASFALGLALIAAPAAVFAQAAPAAAVADPAKLPGAAQAAKFKTDQTTIGDILDNPAASAVVKKYLPEMLANDQINMARGMTLKSVQQYSADTVTDKVLASIDDDFAKLGGK